MKNIKSYTKQFYKNNRLCFAFAFTEVVFSAAISLVMSWLLQQLLDVIGGNSAFTLLELTLISLAICLGAVIGYLIVYNSKPRFITRGISQYKEYVFSELTKKNISAFSGENSSVYISALTNDITAIEKGYLTNTFTLCENLLTFVGAIVLMLYYSPLLTLISTLLALFPLVASILTGNKMAEAERAVSDRNQVYTSTLKDCLCGFSVIKSFKAEAQMLKMFGGNVKELAHASEKKQKTHIIVQMLSNVAGLAAQIGVFIFGAYLAMSGKAITAGTTLVFVQLMNYVLQPIGTIPTCLAERKAARALIEKIAEAINTNVREEQPRERFELKEGIRIRDLSFGYNDDKTVLQDIDLNFELGKKYAVVGASGSGKSTLLSLLMASYPNYNGSISYDSRELREINSADLYEVESIIQQNVFVFNATIRDNITMFREFPEDEIENAIRLSGLSELIAEKDADYLCGENGSGLSGGEKQRISIARSLLKKSQVLLVDEATAALDAETAFGVSNAFLSLEGITAIVVTHNLDAALLSKYDSIITLKNGKIAESGRFDELIEKKGYFYSLFTVSQ